MVDHFDTSVGVLVDIGDYDIRHCLQEVSNAESKVSTFLGQKSAAGRTVICALFNHYY